MMVTLLRGRPLAQHSYAYIASGMIQVSGLRLGHYLLQILDSNYLVCNDENDYWGEEGVHAARHDLRVSIWRVLTVLVKSPACVGIAIGACDFQPSAGRDAQETARPTAACYLQELDIVKTAFLHKPILIGSVYLLSIPFFGLLYGLFPCFWNEPLTLIKVFTLAS